MVTLVTGAPGWLGNRFLERLSEEDVPNHDLRCLVLSGVDPTPVKRFTSDIVFGDLRKPETLRTALRDVDVVFHLAALLYSPRVRDYYEVNSTGTGHLVSEALLSGVQRFVHVSSDAAIGPNPARNLPLTEQSAPHPLSAYGRSKLLGEEYVRRAYMERGLMTTIVRPYWMYGPGQSGRTIHLLRSVRSGFAPIIGHGAMRRTLTFVDDAAEALLLSCASKKAVGKTYFIGDNEPYRLRDIYGAIAGALQVPLRTVPLPAPASWTCQVLDGACGLIGAEIFPFRALAELRHDIWGNIDTAKNELGFEPSTTLEEGMRQMVTGARAQGQL